MFLAAAAAVVPPGQSSSQVLFHDPERDIAVRYAFTPEDVELSSYLPAGWTFSVAVDGDRNGRWGHGAETGPAANLEPTADRRFGQDARNGIFCAQSILTAYANDPTRVYSSTECDGYPSRGRVEMSQLDGRASATITLRIPLREIFGGHPDAHLQICVWDMRQWNCRHTPADPFILRNPSTVAETPN